MPVSKQGKKRVRQNEIARVHNRSLKSAMKTAIKRVNEACTEKNGELAQKSLAVAMKRIDKCAKSNVVHANMASRKKSQLARLVAGVQ